MLHPWRFCVPYDMGWSAGLGWSRPGPARRRSGPTASHTGADTEVFCDGISLPTGAVTDLSFVETHDCFTVAELIEYEAMGLAPEGQGARAALEGWTAKDGRLPVNRSGGLKSKGHPIGATGVSMHVLTAMQLTGQAGAIRHGITRALIDYDATLKPVVGFRA